MTFGKKLHTDIADLPQDIDERILYHNEQPTHQGKICCGCASLATLEDGERIWKEKFVG